MGFNQEELDVIETMRGVKGCEGFTEKECFEAWVESVVLGFIEE